MLLLASALAGAPELAPESPNPNWALQGGDDFSDFPICVCHCTRGWLKKAEMGLLSTYVSLELCVDICIPCVYAYGLPNRHMRCLNSTTPIPRVPYYPRLVVKVLSKPVFLNVTRKL